MEDRRLSRRGNRSSVAGRGRRTLQGLSVLAASAGLALGLAACGGGSPSATKVATGSATGASSEHALEFASCVRSHGVPNFPDSAVQINGDTVEFHLTKGSGFDPSSPQFQSASNACRKYLPAGAAGGAPSSAHTNQLLQWVHCLRTHGIPNFPEPDADGRITARFGPGTGIDPSSPQFQQAVEDCKSLQPAGLQM
ncbi:MAG TPA: hypothetical protein VMD59_20240 [Acidimicrobiales bacterium]|nr:hypothetical protein [Acidimicrobiales bacterium]